MTQNVEFQAFVECHGDQATVRFADGSSQQVPRAVLVRSTVLRQAVYDTEFEASSCVAVPGEMLQSWLQWLRISGDWDSTASTSEQPSEGIAAPQELATEHIIRYVQVGIPCKLSDSVFLARNEPSDRHVPDIDPPCETGQMMCSKLNTWLRRLDW